MCCSVVILFACVVLLLCDNRDLQGCCVVWCGSAGNNKVVRWWCGVVVSKVINKVWIILLVWIILWIGLWIGWEMRKRLRGLYPMRNSHFSMRF